ncbi:MAG: sulfotransferase family protein [Terriglobia bacterium]
MRNGNTSPVFVVGCPRSGTTLLHHMILSAGDFALARFESDTFSLLAPRFADLASLKARKRLMDFWLASENFVQSGLNRDDIEPEVLRGCRDAGDFLRIVMETLCRKQNVHRWAEKTPDHALYIPQIKQSFPEALIVHIIRDGRDAALSLAKFGRIRPFFWTRGSGLVSFGLFWQWMVRRGRSDGQKIGQDYYELRYEDLVEKPQETLARLGDFIHHDLDYDRIRQVGIGSVTQPDSSFKSGSPAEKFAPVGRWKKHYTPEELARFEALVGEGLEEMGYPLATRPRRTARALSAVLTSAFYELQLESKHWLKSHTPAGRLVGTRTYRGVAEV